MNADTLNTLVTGAIWRAEQLEERRAHSASLAWAEVSALEEELAAVLSVSSPEGRIARRGAVRAALKARDYSRAQALYQRYLADVAAPESLRATLGLMLEEDARALADQFHFAAKHHAVQEARELARRLKRGGAFGLEGGVGRSLFLATAARFLASLGQKVVVLDLDFEAPGLHYKLDTAARQAEPGRSGGVVLYLLATAHGAASPPPLAEHMAEVPVPGGSGGWLRLMPAGPAPDQVYWAALQQLREQSRFDDPSGQGLMPLLDLHARIAEELKPEYLLLDVRAGVTDLGGIATTVLADTVVCMSGADRESIDGTFEVAKAIKAAPRLQNQRQIQVVPVLARATIHPPAKIERSLFGDADLLSVETLEGAGTENGREPGLLFLPQGDALETARRLADAGRTASELSPLEEAYLKLIRELFPVSSERVKNLLEAWHPGVQT